MTAVLLTVNLDEFSWRGIYAADVEDVQRTGMLRKVLPVPELPAVDHGVDVWFLSEGRDAAKAGLAGHGILSGAVSENLQYGERSWDLSRRPAEGGGDPPGTYLLVDVDVLLPRGDEVPAAAMLRDENLLSGPVDREGLGITVQVLSTGAALALRLLWSARMSPTPGSPAPGPGSLPSAAVRRGIDNRLEADPTLRRTVLAHRGSVCHGCGLDGEQVYGPAGSDLMQLHLITPPALVDEDFVPDALVDLVPLCPSCHVVVHSGDPAPFTVSQVRSMLRSHGYLPGAVVTEHQLEAEDAAERILEAGT